MPEYMCRKRIKEDRKIRKLYLAMVDIVRKIEKEEFPPYGPSGGSIKIDFGHGVILPCLWTNWIS